MKTSIVISLDTRRQKDDGTYPLILRLTHHEKTTAISLGISLHKKDWDEKSRAIRKSYKGTESVSRLNNLLQKQRTEATDIIVKLFENDELNKLTVSEIKAKIEKPTVSQSFFAFADKQIYDLQEAKRFGTAKSYKEVLHVIKQYVGERDLSFNQINFQFLTRFETAHIAKGNSLNGLAVYMRTIRALYNKAIKSDLIDGNNYPFTHYKVKSVPTEKRALEWDLLKKIILLELSQDHILFNTRNYFVASYMMYGMNFSDMAFLRKNDIRDGRIQYRRKKTSKLYDIRITEALENILSHYSTVANQSEFVFPILKSPESEQQYREILWARKRYNTKLKLLAQLLNIDQKLTSYVSRHSFATQAMLFDIPLNAISAMLGHSNIKTTEIYLKSLPSSMLDNYNSKLLEFS